MPTRCGNGVDKLAARAGLVFALVSSRSSFAGEADARGLLNALGWRSWSCGESGRADTVEPVARAAGLVVSDDARHGVRADAVLADGYVGGGARSARRD